MNHTTTWADLRGRRDFIPVSLVGLGSAAAVLWDIDGTLLTSGGVAARAFLDAVEHVAGARADITGIDFGGRIDPEIATLLLATVGHGQDSVPPTLARLRQLMQERHDRLAEHTRVLAGVEVLLKRLDAAGVRQTVVTGNVESVARLKLSAAALVPPIDLDVGGFGDSGQDRVAVARSALERLFGTGWAAKAGDVWIIGDTPRDLACARALGLRCALVGTGHHSAESMAELDADLVLPHLGDPAAVDRWWRGV